MRPSEDLKRIDTLRHAILRALLSHQPRAPSCHSGMTVDDVVSATGIHRMYTAKRHLDDMAILGYVVCFARSDGVDEFSATHAGADEFDHIVQSGGPR